MKLRAALWLLLALGVALACTLQFAAGGRLPVQTNLLALLPPTERNPVAEDAVARLADAAGNRAVFLVGASTPVTAAGAARTFAAALRASGSFAAVIADIPPFDPRQLTRLYLPHRFSLLADSDRRALAAGDADLEGRLQRKLYTPFRLGPTLSPADDPFGFTDAWLAALPLASLKLQPEDGLLVTRDTQHTWVFVSAELPGSAYDGTVQQRVATAVAGAEAVLTTAHADAELLRTGTVFYGDAARRSAEREFDLIGAGSLLGMLAMLYLVFRSLRPLGLGLLSVAFGIGAAVAVSVAVHGELHLITLVFGAALIGEAIDYSVQYFAAHLGAGQDWEPMAGLRRIAPGLCVALATSTLGYGALMLAPFPALAQIALFALVGLGAAWLSVFLLLPALLRRPSRRDPVAAVAGPQRFLLWWQAHMGRRVCLLLAAALLLLAAPGWPRLAGNDDIRLLVARPPALVAQEEKIRALTGFGNSSQFFLVEGDTPDAVLAHEEALVDRLRDAVAREDIGGFQALSAFVPALATQAENRRLWQQQVFAEPAALRAQFARSELRDDIADRLLADFAAAADQPLRLEDWLLAPLATPFRHLWLGPTAHGYASIVLPQGVRELAPLADAAAGLPGVTLVDKAGSVSTLFRSYREWGAVWLIGAMALVYGVLCVRYRWRQAAVTLAPTLLAMAIALGLFGYAGAPLTLFNLMALMLVLGVGVNYAIFLREGGVRAAATLAGVLLSAATTLLSFGLLAFSSMPALSGFGLTLLVGVGIAVLLAPIVLSFAPREAA
ncbi:MAG: MMPL family transporter [Proteobacteria bacterium]|nr:MMPL family transporter [Pseudomonadota bacterium]